MKAVSLGNLTVPAIAAGMMRIRDKSDAQIRELYDAARTAGVNFFDHADIYGGSFHRCESRFAEALALSDAERSEILIQTKCGIVPGGPMFDFSYEHIMRQVDGSLAALQTDYIDVLLLHRPDALVEPAEVARAFDELEAAGKVRAFGVSNHTAGQIEFLRTAVTQPIVANQVQLSIMHAPLIAQGIAANMQEYPQSVVRDGGGLLEYCRMNDITLQAWSPMQSGLLDGVFIGDERYPELNAVLERLAEKYGVTPTGIAVAWITRHPAGMQVVTGTTTPARLAESAAGTDVVLERAEWYELLRAGGYIVP